MTALHRPGPGDTAATETHRAIEAVWRIESAVLIARLARIVGDIGTAEELAQDALVAALEQWPASGVPEQPGAWLMGTAKHRAIDLVRRRQTLEEAGLRFSGMSPDGLLPEIVEIPDHPWFIGVQFHPELKSKPFEPHPLFTSFVRAALDQSRLV